jgi:hypothetical protein
MNLTISVDDALLERARKLASRRGTSVQELLRAHLEALVGQSSGKAAADELLELMQMQGGHSGGRRITREEAYEGRS